MLEIELVLRVHSSWLATQDGKSTWIIVDKTLLSVKVNRVLTMMKVLKGRNVVQGRINVCLKSCYTGACEFVNVASMMLMYARDLECKKIPFI